MAIGVPPSPVLVLSLLMALPSMDSGSRRSRRLVPGVWGGRQISMEVTATGGRVELDCAHGSLTEPLVVRSGRFDVKGTFAREHGGPVREDEDQTGPPARYKGRVSGHSMTLTITLEATREEVGSFTLTEGKLAALRKCL